MTRYPYTVSKGRVQSARREIALHKKFGPATRIKSACAWMTPSSCGCDCAWRDVLGISRGPPLHAIECAPLHVPRYRLSIAAR